MHWLTAAFFKTNHLKQRAGLDICRECVGLKIPSSFQVHLYHHSLADPNSQETKNRQNFTATSDQSTYKNCDCIYFLSLVDCDVWF